MDRHACGTRLKFEVQLVLEKRGLYLGPINNCAEESLMKSSRKGDQGLNKTSRLDCISDWLELAAKSKFKVARIASSCHISERQLRRVFCGKFNQQLREWIGVERMELARGMLKEAAL